MKSGSIDNPIEFSDDSDSDDGAPVKKRKHSKAQKQSNSSDIATPLQKKHRSTIHINSEGEFKSSLNFESTTSSASSSGANITVAKTVTLELCVAALRRVADLYTQFKEPGPGIGTRKAAKLLEAKWGNRNDFSHWNDNNRDNRDHPITHASIKDFTSRISGFGKESLWLVQELIYDPDCVPWIESKMLRCIVQGDSYSKSSKERCDYYKSKDWWQHMKLEEPPFYCYCHDKNRMLKKKGQHGDYYVCRLRRTNNWCKIQNKNWVPEEWET